MADILEENVKLNNEENTNNSVNRGEETKNVESKINEIEGAEKENTEKENTEKENVEKENTEKENVEKENAEKENAEKENAEKENAEKENAEKENAEKENAEKENAEKEVKERKEDECKFFVGGISYDCWEDDVLQHFSKYGKVKEVQVMKEGNGRNRGFCYVTMENKEAYDAVFKDEHTIKKKKVDVRSMQQENLKKKVFVGGINVSFKEEDLKNYFSKFGELEKATIMRDPVDGRSRGFGFVVFCEESSASKCLKSTIHQISEQYKVEVRKALKREKQPKNLLSSPYMNTGAYNNPSMFGSSPWCVPQGYNQGCDYSYGYGASSMGRVGVTGGFGVSAMSPGGYGAAFYTGGGGNSQYGFSQNKNSMFNYGTNGLYAPQRSSPTVVRGRGAYRTGPY